MEVKTNIIPSVVGVGSTDIGMLNIGRRSSKKDRPLHVVWRDENGSHDYLVGEGVADYAKPVERMDYGRLSNGEEMMSMTFAAISSVLPDETVRKELSIIVGLPIAVMRDRSAGLSAQKTIRSWLQKRLLFAVDDKEYDITVDNVSVLPQPAGAYFTWGYDDMGRWSRKESEHYVAVCDVGFNTVDLYVLKDSTPVKRYTDGQDLGVRRAAETLSDMITNEYGVRYSLHELDELLRSSNPMLHIAQGDIPIKDLVDRALTVTTAGITTFMEKTWEEGNTFRVMIFTGGGSILFKPYLQKHYANRHFFSESTAPIANAIGLARFGKKVFGAEVSVIGLDPGYGGFKVAYID